MPTPRPQDSQAVDRWLRLSLAQRYDAILREPLPDALRKLLGAGEG